MEHRMKGQIMSENINTTTGEITGETTGEISTEVAAQEVHVGTPVFVFEGEAVTDMEGKLPAVTFDMPEGYPRGTILRMVTEYRVRNVRYEENRAGDLVRQHIMGLHTIELAGAYNPALTQEGVGGSLAGRPQSQAPAAEPAAEPAAADARPQEQQTDAGRDDDGQIPGQSTLEEQIAEHENDQHENEQATGFTEGQIAVNF